MSKRELTADPDFRRKSFYRFQSNGRIDEGDPWASLYGRIFVEDVRHHVMPISGTSDDRPDFSIRLLPDTSTTRQVIAWAFVPHGIRYRDPTSTLSAYIQDIASRLVYSGVLYYEILKADPPHRDNGTDRKTEWPIPDQVFRPMRMPGHVLQLGGTCVQLLSVTDWKTVGKPFILIHASDVWQLQIPPELGGPRRHRSFLRTLVSASQLLPEFVEQSGGGLRGAKDFNYQRYRSQKLLLVASESVLWGWTARELWWDESLEYFHYYRTLRYARSMAVLREYIVAEMNKLLRRMGCSLSLAIAGLPSPGDIDGYITDMEQGRLSFDDAWKAIRI